MNISVFLPRALPRAMRPHVGARKEHEDIRWVQGLGNSLAPFVRPEDSVRVKMCAVSELEVGDLALLKAGGRFEGRIVLSKQPLTVATSLGRTSSETPLELVGRIVAVRRGRFRLPVPAPVRIAAMYGGRALALAREVVPASELLQQVRALASSRSTVGLRRLGLGELATRRLVPADRHALTVFAGRYLPFSSEFVQAKLMGAWATTGAAVGTFDERGRLRGFAFLDDYRDDPVGLDGFWIRSVFVPPIARNMGVARSLIHGLCVIATQKGVPVVRAAIESDNVSSLTAFAREGFVPSSEALTRELNEKWRRSGSTRSWVIVERHTAREP